MNKTEATRMIQEAMTHHGLLDSGWAWRWDNAKSRMGCCFHSRRLLTFSRDLFARNGEEKCRDTVLHEIAHALVGKGHGHDATWKRMCRQIGANPTRCHDAEMADHRYTGKCDPACHRHTGAWKRRRLTNSTRYGRCPKCKTTIEWYDNKARRVAA